MSFLRKLFGKSKDNKPEAKAKESPPAPKSEPAPPEMSMIQINEMMVHELAEDLEAGADLVVVDLRQPWEYDQGHISGAINIPMMAFMEGYQTIPKDKKVVMQCYHGFTSLDASGYLISQGWESDKIYSLSGGITGWVQTYGINALVTDDES